MPLVAINIDKCDPTRCPEGRCGARKICPTKALFQEEPGETPFVDLGRCNACAKCVGFCPVRAIYPIS